MLVDEALSVGDFRFQRKSYNRMKELQDRCTFIVVSHSAQVLMRICDRIAWIHEGRLMSVGDPEETVEKYETYVGGGTPDEASERQPEGSGEAVLTSVEMVDGEGRARTLFPPDAPVTLRLTCRAREWIEQPVFGVLIWDDQHRMVWAWNTYWAKVTVPGFEGERTVEFHIDRLPLLPGRYDLCAAVSDSEAAIAYDWHDRALTFSIRDLQPGPNAWAGGIVRITGRWQVD